MAILFTGVVMAHYTHFNLSPTTQVTAQQTSRMLAFVAETVVFAYLGLATTTMVHRYHLGFIFCTLFLIVTARAANIFPLSRVVNRNRSIKITAKQQFVMWFSGLRGAIAFSLAIAVSDCDRVWQWYARTTPLQFDTW